MKKGVKQSCRGGEPTRLRPNDSLLLHPRTTALADHPLILNNCIPNQQPSTHRLQGHRNLSQTMAHKGPRLVPHPNLSTRSPATTAESWGTLPETAQNQKERVPDRVVAPAKAQRQRSSRVKMLRTHCTTYSPTQTGRKKLNRCV